MNIFNLVLQLKFILIKYKIKKHNKFFFNYQKKKLSRNILIEITHMASTNVCYSYISKVLSKLFNANLVGYKFTINNNYINKILFKIINVLGLMNIDIYKSFGVKKFIFFNPEKNKNKNNFYENILKNIKNKTDLENLSIYGIHIGDLIYDSYLRYKKKPTIDFYSKEFIFFFYDCMDIFLKWNAYFKRNNIAAVVVTHTVYLNAIPLRIAIKNNILAYQINLKSIFLLNKKECFAYKQYKFYPKIFSKFSVHDKRKSLIEAKNRLDLRFKGEIGIDMSYSKKSAYRNISNRRLIKKSNKIKILVASHCFFDSPHSYGNNFFTDFYEWLEFLGKISLVTDYDWYIKTHPDFFPLTLDVVKVFVKKYPKFILLNPETSHNQIINEGINFALTIYGTIACEYAARGLPVINASVNNPHIKYDFSINPKNFNSYKKILMNLAQVKLRIKKEKVYEYYYMQNLYYKNALIFGNYNNFIKKIGGYEKTLTIDFYNYYLKNFNVDEHKLLLSSIEKFVKSKYYMSDIFFKDLNNKVNKFIVKNLNN
jgi:hypothetical protein